MWVCVGVCMAFRSLHIVSSSLSHSHTHPLAINLITSKSFGECALVYVWRYYHYHYMTWKMHDITRYVSLWPIFNWSQSKISSSAKQCDNLLFDNNLHAARTHTHTWTNSCNFVDIHADSYRFHSILAQRMRLLWVCFVHIYRFQLPKTKRMREKEARIKIIAQSNAA